MPVPPKVAAYLTVSGVDSGTRLMIQIQDCWEEGGGSEAKEGMGGEMVMEKSIVKWG